MLKLGKRDGDRLVGFLSITLSPLLIMLMIGSLVWFLVDVFYGGKHPDRLLWCLSFFVFGIVLLARLSIQEGWQRALGYTLALAGVTFLAMLRFVEYKNTSLQAIGWVFSLALMALAWWLASRITWDCTYLDEERETSGRGLLSSAKTMVMDPDVQSDEPAKSTEQPSHTRAKAVSDGWLTRMVEHWNQRKKRPQTPGTWIFFFALAGLPVFALGQSFVPLEDLARRRATFVEAALFVGSGLALLATTSLFGLCRYIQERGSRVPLTMPLGWLSLAGILVVLFLLVGSFFPRPYAEERAFASPTNTANDSPERPANRYAKSGSSGSGEGDRRGDPPKQEKPQGTSGGKNSAQSQRETGNSGPAKNGDTSQAPKNNSSSESKSSGKSQGKNSSESSDSHAHSSGDAGKSKSSSDENRPSNNSDQHPSKGQSQSDKSDTSIQPKVLDSISQLIRWLGRVLIALLILAVLFWFVVKGLAPFTSWANQLLAWLQNILASRQQSAGNHNATIETNREVSVRFQDFRNPFADGTAHKRPQREIALYTFSALCAWGNDRGQPRHKGETPDEYALRLGEEYPTIGNAAQTAATAVIHAEFAAKNGKKSSVDSLKTVWADLER
jgi:hypothetical protein